MPTIADYTRPLFHRERNPNKPNIVFLMADQLRYDCIAALGAKWMRTPTMDRLVHEGCAFTQATTPAPICVPARHHLITGLTSRYTGIASMSHPPIPTEYPRIAEVLAGQGYHCEAVGKMHFGPERTHHGFHRMQIMEETPIYEADDDYLRWLRSNGYDHIRNHHGVRNLIYSQPQRSLVPAEATGTAWVGLEAARVVKENFNRPFFLFASWIAPHPPQNCPDEWADLYRDAELPEPTPCSDTETYKLRYCQRSGRDLSPAAMRRYRELYYAQVSFVDHAMGEVVRALEEIGQLDNTLICLFSDHGEMLGDQGGAMEKGIPHEASVRIPLVLRYPAKFAPGSRREDCADLLDLFPTVLETAGAALPTGIDYRGESLLKPAGESTRDRSEVYIECYNDAYRWIALRGPRYKLAYWYLKGIEEFYDLAHDPGETHNLLNDPLNAEHQREYDRLKARLIAEEIRCGPDGGVENGTLRRYEEIASIWPPEERAAGINWQFQAWPNQLPENERAALNSEAEEVFAAIAKEPLTDLSRLDLDFYEDAGGDPAVRDALKEKEKAGLRASTGDNSNP